MKGLITIKTEFDDLIKLTNKIINKGWIKSSCNGYGSSGITFEKEIGIETNNFEIPDFNGIEIKTKISKKESHFTLFCCAPDGYLFEIKRIYETYAHKRYDNSVVFNLSVYTYKKVCYYGNYYKLKVDKENQKIVLMIYDKNDNVIDDKISWSFDIIKEKVERKIKKLFIVYGEKQYINNKLYFRYKRYYCYVLKSFDCFMNALEKGIIRISFSIGTFINGKRKGQIYDHGTMFNINSKYLLHIYNRVYKST